jgi:DNA-binding NarL/FixJ family response regulator
VIHVLIADDQALVRAGFRVILESQDDMQVVGEAGNGHEAVEAARRLRPHIVLMDIRMPGLDGIEATRRVLRDESRARVLILTTFDLDEYVYESLRAGASGFLLKDAEPTDLLDAIRVVADGGSLLAPSVTRRVIEHFGSAAPAPEPHPQLGDLTDREREIVAWVATGMSNGEIAERLVVSPDTVRTHVSRAMVKLAARDRAQLVVFAIRSGLEPPAP